MNLDDLLEKAKRATPGPRFATVSDDDYLDQNVWTISLEPTEVGWENDRNCPGYGLYKDDADFFAACSPETVTALILSLKDAMAALEQAIDQLEYHHENDPYIQDAPVELKQTLAQIKARLDQE